MGEYKYKPVIQTVAILTIMIGVFDMIGWIFNIEILKTVIPGYVSMKFNTALCFVLSGSYLLYLVNDTKKKNSFLIILPLLVIFLSVVTISEYNFKYTSFIDEFFVRDFHSRLSDFSPPGRMSKATSFCFIIIAVSLLKARSKNYRTLIIIQWGLHLVSLISVLAVLGYLYKVPNYYALSFFGSIALHTAIAFFCLSICISLINPSYVITGLLTGNKIGNIMARRLYPVIVVLILGITYFRLEVYRQSTLGMEFTTIMFTTFVLLANLFLVWMTAVQLNKIDIKRKTAEESLLLLNKELEQKVEERTCILQDTLRQLNESQNELKEALNKEKELNEMKSRFVSMASHEFKTPLSTILSSASLVSNYTKPTDNDNRDRHVQRIKNSVKHLNSLLEDFLSLGKLDESRINIDSANFSLKEFMDDVMEEINVELKAGQTIQLMQNGPDEFITDKRLFKNILLNILGNAAKFSPENSVIFLEIKNNGSSLFLSVKDNGIGILNEDKQHLFSTFFRGRNAVSIEGTGLGLHIVKRYIDLLHGTVNLQSETGKGTEVIIALPFLHEKTHSLASV
jgi:signal transduction histidine kinase